MGALLALVGAYGVFLIYTAVALGWKGLGIAPTLRPSTSGWARLRRSLDHLGLDEAPPRQLLAAGFTLFVVATGVAFVMFGGAAPALAAGAFAATFPVALYRQRRQARLARARQAWPRMIEEIRLQTASLGRSIPQALFEVGRRGPEEMRSAFAGAERLWLISGDFSRTTALLKVRLADPTADATCETLLVAHEIGGNDLDRRLSALVDDRIQDLQGRRDAQAKQAGVRFARRFVLIVPVGMALAGLSIGTGRAAYETPLGQVAVVTGIASVVGCWLWAGRLLVLPNEERVFDA